MTSLPSRWNCAALPRWEPWLAAGLAALLLVANLVTATLYPVFGDDDVLLSDAGANLHLGHGFTSTAWPGQPASELFGGNLPLYPLLLAAWLKVFGFGFLPLRAFSYLCGSLTLVCLWWAIRRLGWIGTPLIRLAFLVAAFLSWPVFMAYRRNRYDALQVLLIVVLLAIWASSLRARSKAVALFAVSLLVACSGLQAAAFVGLVCGLAVLWQRRAVLGRSIAVVAGLASGGVGFFAWLWRHRILGGLLENIAWGKRIDGETPENLLRMHLERLGVQSLRDTGMVALLGILCVVISQKTVREKRPEAVRLAVVGIGGTAAIALGMEMAIHFAPYYRWMTLLPLAIFAFAILDRTWPELSHPRRWLAGAGVLFMIGFGAPFHLLYGYATGAPKQLPALEEMARRALHPGDIVFAEYAAYPAVKPLAARAYFPGYLERMTPAEEASITALVVRKHQGDGYYGNRYGDYDKWFSRNGSRWIEAASVPPHPSPVFTLLARFSPARAAAHERRRNSYQLTIFRRAP